MIKKIFSAVLSIVLIITSAQAAFAEYEMENVFSRDFSAVEESYDVEEDGWKASHAVSYGGSGIKVSGNDASLIYTKSLGAKFDIHLEKYYYEWNLGQLWINSDAARLNGYHISMVGQYSSELKVTFSEFRNGVKTVLNEEVWNGANTGGMYYHIDIFYDRGDFYFKLTNASKPQNIYELRYDLTEGGTNNDFIKSGLFRVYGGNGGMLLIKAAQISTVKSDLEVTYLSEVFNSIPMYSKDDVNTAKVSINKEIEQITAVKAYIDDSEQAAMSYDGEEFKPSLEYNDGKFIFTLPRNLSEGLHTLKVVFKDELECEKAYEGKFYIGTYKVAHDGYFAGDTQVTSLAEAADSTLDIKIGYAGISDITAVACLYNSDGMLERIFSASGKDGKISLLCDIPADTYGYTLSVQTIESLVKPVPLSFALELK